MSLWLCTGCTAAYAVGAPRCPQCGSNEYVEEGEHTMPKITVHGGPTNASAGPGHSEEEGEQPSAGSSSSPSSVKPPTSGGPNSPGPRKPARTTASRSKRAPTGSSSARGTGGDQTADTSASEDTAS